MNQRWRNSLSYSQNPFHILPQDIKFDINRVSGLERTEIGMRIGIRDYRHAYPVVNTIKSGKACPIYCHRAFLNNQVTECGVVSKCENMASIIFCYLYALPGCIHMSLYNMPVEQGLVGDARFKVYSIAGF